MSGIENYDASSIRQLSFREGVRTRVGIYLGSADHTGVLAGLLELVNNATDEALVCKTANKIELVIGKDWASCRDYGRGMPHGKNSFSEEVMINLLTENHSGAKFDEKTYGGKSRGLNGTGSAATCCSSDWFKISSYRDGAEWYMEFEEGIPKWKTCQKKPIGKNKNGTYIVYKPSQEVFKSEPICFNYKEICEQMKEYSYFNPNITFSVKDNETGEEKSFISKNGLTDFVKDNISKPIHAHPLHIKASENDIDVEIIMQWTGSGKEKFYLFSNGGENPLGGTPITGIKTSLTNFFKKQIKNGDPDILRKGLEYVCSVNLKDPIYDGQTKGKITNPELRGLCQRLTTKMLDEFSKKYKSELEKIVELFAKEIKAEEAANKARQQVLSAAKDVEKNQKKKVFASDKLKDAEFLGQNSTLLIVEGDSAAGGMAKARDYKKYGILAIRGKILNCLSHTEEKIFQNEEIKLLLSAMNIVPGKYNSQKLRYGRIAICTDADSDGYHIGLLIMAALRYLAPQFLEENRLCWLRSPLYIVKSGKKESYYFTDEEYNAVRGKIKGEVVRAKGLGALSPEQAHNSMFTDEFQRMDVLAPTPEAIYLLEQLMGEDVGPRKKYVFSNIDFSEIRE